MIWISQGSTCHQYPYLLSLSLSLSNTSVEMPVTKKSHRRISHLIKKKTFSFSYFFYLFRMLISTWVRQWHFNSVSPFKNDMVSLWRSVKKKCHPIKILQDDAQLLSHDQRHPSVSMQMPQETLKEVLEWGVKAKNTTLLLYILYIQSLVCSNFALS